MPSMCAQNAAGVSRRYIAPSLAILLTVVGLSLTFPTDARAAPIDTGDGADGALSPAATFNLNTDTSGARVFADGIAYRIDAGTATGTSVDRFSGADTLSNGIAAGDEVLLINLQGVAGDTADVGNYEFLEVLSVTASTLTFTSLISNSYDGTTPANQMVVVQRVPNYTTVSLDGTDLLTASGWDGLTTTPSGSAGYLTGMVVFRATGAVSVGATASIDVNGLGYRGGAGGSDSGGINGESYDGTVGSGGNDTIDGGGGGNPGTDGGGGSSNYSDPDFPVNTNSPAGTRGGGGGGGNQDAVVTTDGAGGAGGGGYGGGGGGGGGGADNSLAGGTGGLGGNTGVSAGGGGMAGDGEAGGTGGNAGSNGGLTSSCSAPALAGSGATTGEGGRGECGTSGSGGTGAGGAGGGGLYGTAALTQLFFGSGGGGGGSHDQPTMVPGGAGGSGGGIIYIVADSVTVTGSVSSDGAASGGVGSREGAGGGGAGGSIWIEATGGTTGASLVTVTGGARSVGGNPGGGGGGGGVGRIHIFAPAIYRSVGITATNLNTSPHTVTITGSTATFSGSMPNNVGVGDVLTYNTGTDQLAFIYGRTSSTVFTVKDKDGGTPTAAPASTAVGVYRAYTSLSNWETQTQNPNITEPAPNDVNPSTDLVTADTVMMVACYGDGVDTTLVVINGWTTGPNNYIKIFTPTSLLEVGIRQRHVGVWDDNKYRLEAAGRPIVVSDENVRFEGLQVKMTSVSSAGDAGILFFGASGVLDIRVSHSIIAGATSATAWHSGLSIDTGTAGSVARFWNNVVYDFLDSVFGQGIHITNNNVTLYAYNNTVYNNGNGLIRDGAGTIIAKNNIAFSNSDDYSGSFDSASDNNLGEDAAFAGDANYVQTSQTAAQMFVDPAGSPPDFHILATSDAADQGANLSSDFNLAVTEDVDGGLRQDPWDIGADDVLAVGTANLTQIHYRWRNDDGGETDGGFISETGSNTSIGSGATASIAHGLAINAGDVIVAMVHGNTSGLIISDNNGSYAFTERIEEDGGGGSSTYAIYDRVAGASEPASYSWDLSTPQAWSLQIRVFSGVDTASVWDVVPSTSTRTSAGSGTTATAPTMTTSTDGAMGIIAFFSDSLVTFSNPSNGYGTEVEPASSRAQASYIRTWAPAGATGTSTADLAASNDWLAHQFALKPAAFAAAATFAAAADNPLCPLTKEITKRLRFEVSNEGTVASGGVNYQLQVAETATCGSGTYAAIPTDTSGHWQIVGSSFITDGQPTSNIVPGLFDEATTFVPGELEDRLNTTDPITLNGDEFTEIEFALQATTNATNGGNYCFRLYNATGAVPLDTYTVYPEACLLPAGGTLTLADHDTGQIGDQFIAATPVTSELFGFKLARVGTVTVDNIRVNFTTSGGVVNGDVTNGELWRDIDNDGVIGGPDTSVQLGVTPSGGVLAFNTLAEDPGVTGTNYLVRATVSNLVAPDTTTFSLVAADIDELEAVTESGSITDAAHTFDGASGGTVYYSVGTETLDLMSGTPTVQVSNGTATFSEPQPNNVGVGDEITYNTTTKVYISSRVSSTVYTVTTPTGGLPVDNPATSVDSLLRAFNSLSLAQAGSSDINHLNDTNLVTGGFQLNWALYNDNDTAMDDTVDVTGWTTGPANYIRIFTPVGPTEVGVSQRHTGRAGTGFRLRPVDATSQGYNVIYLRTGYVRIEGLEIDGSGYTNAWYVRGIIVLRDLSNVGDIRIDSMIIHDLHTTSGAHAPEGSMGVLSFHDDPGEGPPLIISNNIIYDITDTIAVGHIGGIHVGARGTSYVHNNTVYNIQNPGTGATSGPAWGIYSKAFGGGTVDVIAKNNYCGLVTADASQPVKDCYQGRDGATLTQNNNVSSDGTASGAGSVTNRTAYASYFVDITDGSEDLHLRDRSNVLWGTVGEDLDNDPNAPITGDIDGDSRDAYTPDIGADEAVSAGAGGGGGSGLCAFNYLDTPQLIPPPSTPNIWEDVDVSAFVPTGASGAILQVIGDPAIAYDYGVRRKSSSDTWMLQADQNTKADTHRFLFVGLDENGVYQVNAESLTITTYLVGYTGDGVTFFIDAVDKSFNSPLGTYQDVNISADTGVDTAVGAIFHVHTTSIGSGSYGLRMEGGSTDLYQDARAESVQAHVIGVNGSERLEAKIETANIDLYLVGYVTSGAVFFADPIDVSTDTLDAYVDADITPYIGTDDANGAILEWIDIDNSSRATAVRREGATYDYYHDMRHTGAIVAIDDNDVFEHKHAATDRMDLYVLGYTLGGACAQPWWDDNWGARRRLTFDNSSRGALNDFPVMLCIDSSKIDYNKTDGDDLRFVDDNDTDLLNHEVELWDETGTSYVWVKVPQIDGGSNSDFIYMYYDNEGVAAPSQASQEATWSNAFESVYHLHADNFGDATGAQPTGSNNGSLAGSASPLAGEFRTFDGNDFIDLNWTPSYGGDLTWEGWLKLDGIASTDVILGVEDRFGCGGCTGGDNSELRLGVRKSGGGSGEADVLDSMLRPDGNPKYDSFPGLATVDDGNWHHIAMTRSGGNAFFYYDGTQVDTGAVNAGAITFPTRSTWTTTITAMIGAQWSTDNNDPAKRNWFDGDLDEVRTSIGVARSADWMDATYETILNCEAFTSFSSEDTTAVELVSFEALGGDGAVELRWETGSELNNLGFHLYRSLTEEGLYEQITSNVIPGLGSSPEGAKYAYGDSGLANGVTYYYKLEDIETAGATELHGPVSAIPTTEVVVEDDSEDEGGSTGEDLGELSSRITYGDPSGNELKIRRRGKKWMELTLITEGFYAIPQEDGSVLLEVPGFEDFGGPELPDVPAYRTWQDVLAGRNVKLASVKTSGVAQFASLRPSSSELIVVASGDGTVQTGRRRKRRRKPPHVYYPESWAKLMSVGFQGPAKKALVEMAPLRWDATAESLVLARRIVVRIAFKGKDKALKLGKSHREVGSHANRSVYARIAVTEPGLYGVSYESVFGKRKKAIKTSSLRLSRQGEPVAFFVRPNAKKFKKKSVLYFLSDGAELNPYGQEAVYELEASPEGLHMETLNGSPAGAPTSFYWKTVKREENLLYQAAFEGEEDIWQWDWLFGPMTKGYPFEVTNLSPVAENSKLRVWLHGASDFPEDPDHHVRLYMNGTLLTETWWDGETPHLVEAELGPGLLIEGENTLEIEEVGDTEAQYSMVMLDRFEVSYPAQPINELQGSFSQSGIATITGGAGHLFDVTDQQPRRVSGVRTSPEGLSFDAVSGHRYLLAREVLTPEVRPASSTGLRAAWSRAEYLVIGPREFLAAAEPLLAHRRNEGLISGAIATEDIYGEFGYGEATPESIKEFLSYVYHHWREPTLRYVVLLGDGTYDTKDYLATGVESHVPVKIVETRYMWTASDPWYGAINGDDILPDVAIGRLPAASVGEVQALVQKILDYESGEQDPEAPIVLITDNPDVAGNFDADAEEIASTLLAEEDIEKVYLSQLGTAAAHGAILDAFGDGASVMSYLGHGAIHLWAQENLLNVWDVDSLAPQSQQPLLLTMNCLNGYFHFPYFNSLSEELLKAEGKGVIAAFSPTGLSLNSPAHRFHKALLQQVVHSGHVRLGDAILAGQGAYALSGAFPELLSIYHLLGDPALKLGK